MHCICSLHMPERNAVRIPRAFELPGAEGIMCKEDEHVVIEREPTASLLDLLARLAPIEDDFDDIADAVPEVVGQSGQYQP